MVIIGNYLKPIMARMHRSIFPVVAMAELDFEGSVECVCSGADLCLVKLHIFSIYYTRVMFLYDMS